MQLETINDLVGFLIHNPMKLKIILFLSKEDSISKDLLSSLTPNKIFQQNSRLAWVNDEAVAAEEIFELFKVEYVPTCLILNADQSPLGKIHLISFLNIV